MSVRRDLLDRLHAVADARDDDLRPALDALYEPGAELRAFHPVDECAGVDAIEERLWRPLRDAFPDLERRDLIFIGGEHDGTPMVAACGHLVGTLEHEWLGIAPTGGVVFVRYGEFHELAGDRIRRTTVIVDVVDVLHQVGVNPLPPSRGAEVVWPAPRRDGGLRLTDDGAETGAVSIRISRDMQIAMHDDARTRDDLLAAAHARYWHPDFMWYGPGGIGTTRGLRGFVDRHQQPFRHAFPDRVGGHHDVRFGDGPLAVTGGWPSVTGTHRGAGWLGTAASERAVGMRVMDFYAVEDGLIRENWVLIDIVDVLRQVGVDVLAATRPREETR